MGVYEVSQTEYEKVTGTNPSHFSNVSGQDTSRFPVEQVSWYDAIEYCNKLSEKDGLSAYYGLSNVQQDSGSIKSASVSLVGGNGYRLPTEVEWEYACRGGTTTPFQFGSVLNGDKANIDGDHPYGTTTNGTFLRRTTSVGSYGENKFGLFDLHGNVWEWCFDIYDENAYGSRSGTTKDPVVTAGSADRVLRGGCWNSVAGYTRSADRVRGTPGDRDNLSGFRVVR